MQRRTAFIITLMATALLPLIGGLYPPLQDLPNHLLEADVIANPQRYAPWFRLHIHAAPNLLTQLLLATLRHLMQPQAAALVLLLTIQLLYAFGALALCRTLFNRSGAVLALLMLWSWHFFLWRGYLNFSLGCALTFWGIVLYHRTHGRSTKARMLLIVPFALVLYSAHLLCLGVWLSYGIVHELFERKRLSIATITSMTLCIALAVGYAISLPSGEGLSWEYGSGLWKISSLKRILAIPVVSTLNNQLIIGALIIYNLGKYLFFIITLVSMPLYARSLPKGMGMWLLLWAVAYLVLPTKTGEMEVDSRVIFIPLLLASCACVHYLFSRGVQRTALAIGLGSALALQVVVSTAQYSAGSIDLHSRIQKLRTPQSLDKSSLSVQIRSTSALQTNPLYRILEPLRLHTDETQRTLPDLHALCYLFMFSPTKFGSAPSVFETSIVRPLAPP